MNETRIPPDLGRNKNSLTSLYWACTCEARFIHPHYVESCPVCRSKRTACRLARNEEALDATKHFQGVPK